MRLSHRFPALLVFLAVAFTVGCDVSTEPQNLIASPQQSPVPTSQPTPQTNPPESTPLSWDGRATTVSTIIIAGATVVNLLVAILLWRTTAGSTKITRDIFDASHRPYLGVVTVDYVHKEDSRQVEIVAHIKNVGSVPARHVKFQHEFKVNGQLTSPIGAETNFGAIFPGSEVMWSCCTSNDAEYLESLKARLDLRTVINYVGLADKTYRYEYEATRSPSLNKFATTKTDAT